ncbi:tyrosine-type recombinase/integrase [Clostridium sp. 19966]|uniref:tyrosine-type recombinase/integrase n=1 Tax=Clostridium sp. 19966 TaxID=2768166 RepID=UPI0028DF22E3|nr:tyrosine-type recombinase/integrase [Clostridium sp. 19966]MDT8716028.1 tyrosine-type recombinase/integrase [Clostridium sp. 19966]
MELMKISDLISMAERELSKYKYSEYGTKAYTRVWKSFKEYADQKNLMYYTEELLMAYMEEVLQAFSNPNHAPAYKDKVRAINKLSECYKYHTLSSNHYSCRKTYEFCGYIGNSVKEYLEFRSTNVSIARLQSIKLYLERFCKYTDSLELKDIKEINIRILQGFIEFCGIYTQKTVAVTICCIRGYLDYLYKNRIIETNLSVLLPHIKIRKDSEIPSAYSAEDVETLLRSIDRHNSKGKRDYAMILMAARLGLRSSDICGLKFSSLNWENSQVSIIQQKTGEPALLPLTEEVGLAIIDYLKNGRPDIPDNSFVFLRECPPYTNVTTSALYVVVAERIKVSGIHVPVGKKHGPHALRHSLSSRLLENNVPLPVISDILAHKSTETTKIYLKIAENQLLSCALEVLPVNKGGRI